MEVDIFTRENIFINIDLINNVCFFFLEIFDLFFLLLNKISLFYIYSIILKTDTFIVIS